MNIRLKQQLKGIIMRNKLWSIGTLRTDDSKLLKVVTFPKSEKDKLKEHYKDQLYIWYEEEENNE